jgi:adenylate cyclase class IV
MSESNSFWRDYSENVKNKEKISNLKSKIKNTTNDSPIKTYKKTIFSQNSNKSLKLVEKLSQKKNKIGRFRNSLTNEELKLVNHSINQTVDIDEHVAFNLANTIVKRRFKYFGKKKR